MKSRTPSVIAAALVVFPIGAAQGAPTPADRAAVATAQPDDAAPSAALIVATDAPTLRTR